MNAVQEGMLPSHLQVWMWYLPRIIIRLTMCEIFVSKLSCFHISCFLGNCRKLQHLYKKNKPIDICATFPNSDWPWMSWTYPPSDVNSKRRSSVCVSAAELTAAPIVFWFCFASHVQLSWGKTYNSVSFLIVSAQLSLATALPETVAAC